jgi:hypothetical protein
MGHGDMDMGDQCSMNASLRLSCAEVHKLTTNADAIHLVLEEPLHSLPQLESNRHLLPHPILNRHCAPYRGLRSRP